MKGFLRIYPPHFAIAVDGNEIRKLYIPASYPPRIGQALAGKMKRMYILQQFTRHKHSPDAAIKPEQFDFYEPIIEIINKHSYFRCGKFWYPGYL